MEKISIDNNQREETASKNLIISCLKLRAKIC